MGHGPHKGRVPSHKSHGALPGMEWSGCASCEPCPRLRHVEPLVACCRVYFHAEAASKPAAGRAHASVALCIVRVLITIKDMVWKFLRGPVWLHWPSSARSHEASNNGNGDVAVE